MREHFTLTEVNSLLGAAITRLPFSSCWVMAEILQLNQAASGHVYMDLVEKSGNKTTAKMQAVLWSGRYGFLRTKYKNDLSHFLKGGSKVLLQVDLEFHPVYGLKMIVNDLDPSATLGEMELRRQETIAKLEKGQYFNRNNQLPIPTVLQQVAVISSAQAAGYTDFIKHIDSNKYGYKVNYQLFAAAMQGEAAPLDIRKSLAKIAEIHKQFQAVVIIRGGGSKFDLDCFNDYQLAVDIADFPIPVISGIGHERDDTIVDLVAHTPVKTPTAVADLILESFLHYEQRVAYAHQRIVEGARTLLSRHQRRLQDLANRYQIGTKNLLKNRSLKLETLKEKMALAAKVRIKNEQQKLVYLNTIVKLLDIDSTKNRGFSVSRIDGLAITNQNQVKPGDQIETELHTGSFISTVN